MALIFMSALLAATSCNKKTDHAVHDQYTCPMHPTIVQDKPGTCPICGMDLVKKGLPGQEVKITPELNNLLKPTNAMVTSSIRTIMPIEKVRDLNIKANGIITYDTRRSISIPIRFGGRIEKLSIKYNLQPVKRGQELLKIYSPELLTAQRDLLYLITSDKENTELINGAKQKLRLLGISDSQITGLISTGKESYSFPVYSPVNGYVVEEAAIAALEPTEKSAVSSSMEGGMDGRTRSTIPSPGSQISNELVTREGMYVNEGQAIFKVVNTDQVWAEFDVYQRDAASINVNDPVTLVSDNTSEKIEAKVNFIQPFFESGESFVKVRCYLSNAGDKLHIGQLLTAFFKSSSGNSLWIPLSARLDLGSAEIAFTKRRGVFRPKAVVTGQQSGDWIEIVSGLESTDSVAYNAQFMVDSESFIKVRN